MVFKARHGYTTASAPRHRRWDTVAHGFGMQAQSKKHSGLEHRKDGLNAQQLRQMVLQRESSRKKNVVVVP